MCPKESTTLPVVCAEATAYGLVHFTTFLDALASVVTALSLTHSPSQFHSVIHSSLSKALRKYLPKTALKHEIYLKFP